MISSKLEQLLINSELINFDFALCETFPHLHTNCLNCELTLYYPTLFFASLAIYKASWLIPSFHQLEPISKIALRLFPLSEILDIMLKIMSGSHQLPDSYSCHYSSQEMLFRTSLPY